MILLAEIFLYPLKSGAAMPAITAAIARDGLLRDRRMMVVDADGKCITSRQAPNLLGIAAERDGRHLILMARGMAPFTLDLDACRPAANPVDIWGDRIAVRDGGDAAAGWLSHYLVTPCRLAIVGETTRRPLHLAPGGEVNLADTAPILLTQRASLDELNSHLSDPVEMARFRPNLVITGADAFAEDGWRRIRIGTVEFLVAGACDRCVVTMLDPHTGEARADREPLTTLAHYRRGDDGKVYFGQFLVPCQPGRLHVGDPVTVLERAPVMVFQSHSLPALQRKSARPVPSAPGRIDLTCIATVDETHDVRTFRFRLAGGGSWHYRAGQFLTLVLNIDGHQQRRSYTLSSTPTRPETIEITVKRQPGGLVSSFLHDQVSVGDRLAALGPGGRFYLDDSSPKILMLAAGSGVTPMLSMLRALWDGGSDVAAHLHVSVRYATDLIAEAELNWLTRRSDGRLTWSHNLTRGPGGRHFDAAMLDRFCPDWTERVVYCCGPDGYRRDARALVGDAVLHEESFGTATAEVEAHTYQVHFRRSGKQVRGHDARTLLAIARTAGIVIESQCEAGICGTCRCQSISGTLLESAGNILSAAERQAGIILACNARPSGEVVVDL